MDKVGLPDAGTEGLREEGGSVASASIFEGGDREGGVEGVGTGGRSKIIPFGSGLAGTTTLACCSKGCGGRSHWCVCVGLPGWPQFLWR